MVDRRQFLAAAGGTLVAACASKPPALPVSPVPPVAVSSATATAADATAELNKLFETFVDEIFSKSPTLLTNFGLDKGRYAAAKSQLNDQSLERRDAARLENADRLRRLRAFDRNSVKGLALANYETVEFQMETASRVSKLSYGDNTSPYIVSQRDGMYQNIPTFLDKQHVIETREDAEAYISRLRAFAVTLDQETERVKHDASVGVVPPDFIIDKTVKQLRQLREPTPAQALLVTSIATRAEKKGIAGEWSAQATDIVAREVYPAIDRQANAIQALRAQAVHDAGIGRLPDGPALYQVDLRQYTTTDMTAEEIHQLGRDQAAELSAQMDAILKAQGLTQGSLRQRMEKLSKDPKYLYANTDDGRQKILDYCNSLIAALQPHLPKYFDRLPKAPVEVRRVPPYIEAGAAGGYYQRPALDGSRPGAFYINLRNTAELPRWSLPTLTYHESAPGHHFQLAMVLELDSLPLIRKMGSFSANTEGWALYAELLCEEMGLYQDDPLGRLGRLQATIFRAARCVVDTGIHSKGWGREQAIQYMVETTGDNVNAMTSEVERYCVYPGQATSYKVGQTRWLAMRANAREKLGAKFDIRKFHDTGLTAGPMPMSVLARVYDEWIAKQA